MAYKILKELRTIWRPEHERVLNTAESVHPDFSAIRLIADLDSGEMQAWGTIDSNLIVITQRHLYLHKPCLHIALVLGSNVVGQFADAVADLKIMAKELGCAKITALATRAGWARKFTKELGFEPVATEYEMRI